MKNNFFKKVTTSILTLALCLSLVQPVLAGTSTTDVGNYGTLTGTTSSRNRKVTGITRITKNPDRAYLTLKMEAMDINGEWVLDDYYNWSDRGATSLSDSSATLPTDAYKVFATHGVQGGSTNPSYAVYTVTTLT